MNTISTKTYRDKYRMATLAKLLRLTLVSEAIFQVDREGLKTINSPYGSQPTTTIQAIAGTYSTAAYTTTDDTLTVADEFIVAEHVFDFEETLTAFDVFASRVDEQMNSVATAIDKFVLNEVLESGNGTYTTPVGGFTNPANINEIMGDLGALVMGYTDISSGLYLVIESTDVSGFTQAQATNGFSFADSALRNGFMDSYMGIDIYVKRSGTFVDATQGTKTWTNDGHRLFGVSKTATYAEPQGIKFEEKAVSGKTGMEIVTYGYIGAKVWVPKQDLTVDITLA